MAPTKRKRQTKHRGNAAGVVESRGRTGRKPTKAEKTGGTQAQRAREKEKLLDKRDRPPTWRGAFLRAMFALDPVPARGDHPVQQIKPGDRAVPDRARDVYADQLLHRSLDLQPAPAPQGAPGRGKGLIGMSAPDVRSFTVGPVQENSYIVRAGSDARRAVIVDPGDEPERLLEAIDGARRRARGDPHHALPLRPHRRGGARRAAPPARPSTAP